MRHRNHFDEKDMILLVVMLIIIYIFIMFVRSGIKPSDFQAQSQSSSVVTESSMQLSEEASGENSESMESEVNSENEGKSAEK